MHTLTTNQGQHWTRKGPTWVTPAANGGKHTTGPMWVTHKWTTTVSRATSTSGGSLCSLASSYSYMSGETPHTRHTCYKHTWTLSQCMLYTPRGYSRPYVNGVAAENRHKGDGHNRSHCSTRCAYSNKINKQQPYETMKSTTTAHTTNRDIALSGSRARATCQQQIVYPKITNDTIRTEHKPASASPALRGHTRRI
jgi:hypothetical protein